MRRFMLALAIAVPLAAAPAHAADLKTLDCVEKAVDASTRAALASDMERNLANADQAQSYGPAVIAALQKAATTCKDKHKWSPAETEAALLYTVPVLGAATARRMAAANKLNYAVLETRFMALPNNERIDALNETVLGKLAQGAVTAGEVVETNANLAGGIFGLLAVREKALSDFTAN